MSHHPHHRRHGHEAEWTYNVRRLCEVLTEGLLYFMVIFSPWAFGTTQPWSIWTMNICGYTLGALMLVQALVAKGKTEPNTSTHGPRWSRHLVPALAVCTVIILAYCLISALNGRAQYLPASNSFEYFENYIPWLPHSYAKARSLAYFWNYLALSFSFWAVYRWLATDPARQPQQDSGTHRAQVGAPYGRLRRLLWVLAINGSLLAFQGCLQRMDGGNKLLWIQETRMNREASVQFGPYAYRSNAAQYFNLLWPAVLGFWWWLELRYRELGTYKTLHRQLLPLASLMAVCPLISLSRAGALVALAGGFLAALVLLASWPGSKRRLLLAFVAGGMVLLGVAVFFNGSKLAKRFESSSKDLYEGRGASYETGWKMAREYPVLGTGPGTLDPLFQIYRKSLEDYWPVQLHNDWLETAITFGAVGMGVVVVMLLLLIARWLANPHGAVPWPFGALVGLGLGSCLAFAVVDFPFQIYSILFLFLLLCAVLLAAATLNARSSRH